MWSWAGLLLPPGALATGVRNVACFDVAQAAEWPAVLVAWAAAGLVVLVAPGRRAGAAPTA